MWPHAVTPTPETLNAVLAFLPAGVLAPVCSYLSFGILPHFAPLCNTMRYFFDTFHAGTTQGVEMLKTCQLFREVPIMPRSTRSDFVWIRELSQSLYPVLAIRP